MRRSCAALVVTAALGVVSASARDARADPVQQPSKDPQIGALHPVTSDDDPHDEFQAFPLRVTHDKHYVLAGIAVGGIVIVGFVDYLLNTTARGGISRPGDSRWDLRYDWGDLRGKFTGENYELDANRFNTNYIAHPFAGVMYFQAARSGHLSFAESALFGVLGSSLWEYFGEIREHVSVNDMIVTPTSGAAIGEAMMQLSGFFDRGKKNVPNQVLSALFSPVKAVSYLLDAAEPRRTEHPDALGLPTELYHRFELFAGGGATIQQASSGRPRASYADLRFGLETEIANLPGYSGAGRHARLFDDGNVSSLAFDLAMSRGELVHADFRTRIVPVGFYYRNATIASDGHVSGHGALVGLRMGFDYVAHDYDRDRLRPRDLFSTASPIGIAAEHTFERGGLRLRTALDVGGSVSGVQPYALADYRARNLSVDGFVTSARNNGYYHAFGVTAQPSVSLRLHALEWESTLRFDSFRAIRGLDEARENVDASLYPNDRRSSLRTTVALSPRTAPWRLAATAQRSVRAGDIGSVHASRSESSFFGTFGLVF